MKTRFTIAFLFTMLFLSHNLFSNEIEWLIDSISPDPNLDDRFTLQTIAFDEDNTYHMVFNRYGKKDELENGGFTTFYTSKTCDGEWSEPEMIHPYGESTVSASIVHTEEGRIFVCYQRYMPVDYWSDVIYVAEKTDQGWVREQIPTPTDQQNWLPQMTADGNGKLHIIWVSTDPGAAPEKVKRNEDGEICTGHKLAYSTNMSGEWKTQVLDKIQIEGKTLGTRPLIKATPEGTIHMVYRSMLPEPTPESPTYRIWYATNMVPGGEAWETECLITPQLEDRSGLLYLEDDVVHLAIGSFNYSEELQYSYYTKKENGQWSEMIQINKLGYGFPESIKVKDKEVFVTYMSAYIDEEDGIKNGIILWNKDGEEIREYPVVSSYEEFYYGKYLFDNQENIVIPYFLGDFISVPFDEFDQINITESEEYKDKISDHPVATDQLLYQHLVFERENLSKQTTELIYQKCYLDSLIWSEPEVIPVPENYSLVKNSSSIAATQDWEFSEIYVSFIAENIISGNKELVLAKKTEQGWDFHSVPFSLESNNITNNYISTQYGNDNVHVALLEQRQLAEDSVTSVIHYGILTEGEWQIQVLDLEVYTEMISMEISNFGYARFIYPYFEGSHKMTILYNETPLGDSWLENSFETELPVEKLSTTISQNSTDVFLFMAAQVIPENEPSQIYLFICVSDNTILPKLRITSDNNSAINLQNVSGIWGDVILTYTEGNTKNQEKLNIVSLESSFDEISQIEIPEVYVNKSFITIWPNCFVTIATEQGNPEVSDIGMKYKQLGSDLVFLSKAFIARSGECVNPSDVVNPETASGIRIFPNPSNDIVNIQLEEFSGERATISIYDISGRMVYHLEKVDSSDQIKVDVSDFNRGIYLIKATTETQNITRKIIIG